MQVVYLNTNGFCGIGDKHSHYRNNEKIANANQILSKIFKFSNPDILFLSEFDVNSDSGKCALDNLSKRDYYRIYPNNLKWISKRYSSIVMAFTRERKNSESSPNNWLKWNEILINDYRIVGVNIPDSEKDQKESEDFWHCLEAHYKKHEDDKLLYIGDMNVFKEETFGKKKLKSILETSRDGWIEKCNSNNKTKDFTTKYDTRIDYSILSKKMPKISRIENHQEFFKENLSDHSAIMIEF